MYSGVNNLHHRYDLHQSFFSISQGDLSLVAYFARFRGICEELNTPCIIYSIPSNNMTGTSNIFSGWQSIGKPSSIMLADGSNYWFGFYSYHFFSYFRSRITYSSFCT